MTSSIPRWSRRLSILGSYHSVGAVYPRHSPPVPLSLNSFISVFALVCDFRIKCCYSVMVPKFVISLFGNSGPVHSPSESASESVFVCSWWGWRWMKQEAKYSLVPTQLDGSCHRVLQCSWTLKWNWVPPEHSHLLLLPILSSGFIAMFGRASVHHL